MNRLELKLSAQVLQFTSLVRCAEGVAQTGVDEGQETLEDVAGDFGEDDNNFFLSDVIAKVTVNSQQCCKEGACRHLKLNECLTILLTLLYFSMRLKKMGFK